MTNRLNDRRAMSCTPTFDNVNALEGSIYDSLGYSFSAFFIMFFLNFVDWTQIFVFLQNPDRPLANVRYRQLYDKFF